MRIQAKMLETYSGMIILNPRVRKWQTLTSSGYYDVISQNFENLHFGR